LAELQDCKVLHSGLLNLDRQFLRVVAIGFPLERAQVKVADISLEH
jgi:hypothetical protein